MLSFLFRRFNLLIITAFILTILAFIVDHTVTPQTITNSADSENIFSLYITYLTDISSGNFGHSALDGQPLLAQGLNALASTLELCLLAFLFSAIVAIPLGLLAGLYRKSKIDYIIMSIALAGIALPVFWLGVMIVLLPSIWGDLLPIDGDISLIYEIPVVTGFILVDTLFFTEVNGWSAFIDRLAHLLLPALLLSFFLITEIIRLTRHSMTMVMGSNYIKAAYAKGFPRRKIVFTHAILNAIFPIIPQLRLQLSTIFSFAMTIEIVFNLGGIGNWLLDSLRVNDYAVLPIGMLLITSFILLFSMFIEVAMVIINPLSRGSLYADK